MGLVVESLQSEPTASAASCLLPGLVSEASFPIHWTPRWADRMRHPRWINLALPKSVLCLSSLGSARRCAVPACPRPPFSYQLPPPRHPPLLQSAQYPQDRTGRDISPQLREREPSRATPDATRDQRRIPAHPSSSLRGITQAQGTLIPMPSRLSGHFIASARTLVFLLQEFDDLFCGGPSGVPIRNEKPAGSAPDRMTTSAVLGNYLTLYPSPAYSSALMRSTRPMVTRSVPTEPAGHASGNGESPHKSPH